MRRYLILLLAILCSTSALRAQHTFGLTTSYGSSKVRAYPSIETKSVYGLYSGGISWRYYTAERYVGCFGIDLEYIQRGFAYAPYTSTNNNDEGNEDVDLLYYTRRINTLMMPILFQPHAYMLHNRLRVFGEVGITLSYDINSTYQDDLQNSYGTVDWKGDYNYKTVRDNRFGYGLLGGFGASLLIDQLEIKASARYYFGYSDVVKNRNKYYSNNNDTTENPFSYTPIRSPMDNVMFGVGVSYRFSIEGFSSWGTEKLKYENLGGGFEYDGTDKKSSSSSSRSTSPQNKTINNRR